MIDPIEQIRLDFALCSDHWSPEAVRRDLDLSLPVELRRTRPSQLRVQRESLLVLPPEPVNTKTLENILRKMLQELLEKSSSLFEWHRRIDLTTLFQIVVEMRQSPQTIVSFDASIVKGIAKLHSMIEFTPLQICPEDATDAEAEESEDEIYENNQYLLGLYEAESKADLLGKLGAIHHLKSSRRNISSFDFPGIIMPMRGIFDPFHESPTEQLERFLETIRAHCDQNSKPSITRSLLVMADVFRYAARSYVFEPEQVQALSELNLGVIWSVNHEFMRKRGSGLK